MTFKDNYKAYMAWLSICIVWGTTYLAIRIGVEDLPPMLFAGLRWFIAGPILFVYLKMRGYKLPSKSDIPHIAVVGILLLGFGNGFVVFAEQWIPSGLASLLITTTPFWMIGMESLIPGGAKLNSRIIIGLLLGISGVAIIFGNDLRYVFNSEYIGGVIGLMIAVFAWAMGTVYSKYKKTTVHPMMNAAVQMMMAGTLLSIFGVILGETNRFQFTSESLAAFAYLIVFGSLIGYGSYIYAVAHLPVSFVSTYAYINPIIAIFLGWLILDESITISVIVAALVILAGVGVVKTGIGYSKSKN